MLTLCGENYLGISKRFMGISNLMVQIPKLESMPSNFEFLCAVPLAPIIWNIHSLLSGYVASAPVTPLKGD